MHKGRLEAFSDGVLAILITIMVLEMKVPHGEGWEALLPLWPVFVSYVMSFIFLGIYWTNHHHMIQAAPYISGGVLWANLHLLFWLSLVPFVTGWMGENHFPPLGVALYGAVLFCAGVAYYILERLLVSCHGKGSKLAVAVGSDWKGLVSVVVYAIAIPCAFWHVAISMIAYASVAAMWIVPDRRIERALGVRR